jgi:sugar/nucleoside kinase (ribokinase family)
VIENDGAELAEIFRRAKDTGITTSLDMSMPDPRSFSGQVNWPAILSATLPYVDVYMPSLEETMFMLYPARFRELTASEGNVGSVSAALLSSVATDLLTMGPAVVGLKLGHMGLYLRTANETAWKKVGKACPKSTHLWISRELWSPCFQVRVVGTTGAGDATIAGFLAALLRGCSPEESVTMACAVGGCNVEAADALGGLRSWDETQARVRNGWPRRTLGCSLPGWQLLSDAKVWNGVWSRDSDDEQAL